MEAEVLRDSILTASGKLNPKLGGPGIKPRLRPDLLPTSQRNKWPARSREGPQAARVRSRVAARTRRVTGEASTQSQASANLSPPLTPTPPPVSHA